MSRGVRPRINCIHCSNEKEKLSVYECCGVRTEKVNRGIVLTGNNDSGDSGGNQSGKVPECIRQCSERPTYGTRKGKKFFFLKSIDNNRAHYQLYRENSVRYRAVSL